MRQPVMMKVLTIGIVVVEVCDGNPFSRLDLEQLETEFPEVAVLRTECLNRCALCGVRPFAMVNGTRVYARTPQECLDKVKDQIATELAFYHQ